MAESNDPQITPSRFRVYLQTTASCVVEVEASGEDEAVDLAIGEAPRHLCHQCETSRYGSIGVELAGEWDVSEPLAVEVVHGE